MEKNRLCLWTWTSDIVSILMFAPSWTILSKTGNTILVRPQTLGKKSLDIGMKITFTVFAIGALYCVSVKLSV